VAEEFLALKGRNILAQGNALGKGVSEVAAQAEGHSEHYNLCCAAKQVSLGLHILILEIRFF